VQLNAQAADVFQKLDTDIGYHAQLAQSFFSALTRVQANANPKAQAEEFAKRHAKSPVVWAGLAMVMRSLDDIEGERQALTKGIEVGADEPEVWFQQGQFCERQKDVKGAADAYQRLAELRPDDAAANNNVAYCLLLTGGDVKVALEHAKKAEAKMPLNPAVLHTLGVAQLRSGDLEGSRKSLTAALEMKPGDPTVLLDYGLLLNAEKKPDEGKRHIELALKYANQLGLDFPRKQEAEQVLAGK
jgi:Flp pilus assembly protein TadD